MRIMMFAAGGDLGGGKTHILSLAKELSKENDLRLVCFRIGEMSNEAPGLGIDTVAVDHKLGFAHARKVATEQAREFRPDIIHCHGSKANVLGIMARSSTGIPVITTVHSDPELDYMGAPIRNITYGNLNRIALRRMNYHVAVAGRMQDLLISRGFDPQKVFTVYNGMDFSDAVPPKEVKRDPDIIRIGIAARLNPVKDISTLIKAFAIAYEKDKRLRLSIAGSGEEEGKLKELAKTLGVEDVTTFEGWLSDIRGYFKTIDINVLCSLSETFPYSLLEGACERVPAIASNVGGIPYLIEHERTGLLFEAGDANTFAKHILRLAADDELRKTLADALLAKADEKFSLNRMRADQQAIYEKIKRLENAPSRYGAVLCGAYGKGNAGDDAILGAIIKSLRGIDQDLPIYVMSRKPMETKLHEHVGSFFTFDIFKLNSLLRKTKLFVSGGGTLIQDVTSTRSLLFYLYTLRAAHKAGVKVEMYGCGIGPVSSEKNRKRTSRTLNDNVDIIALRDSISWDLLKEINVVKPEIILAADPAVSLPPVDMFTVRTAFEKAGIPADDKKIIFCIRPWEEFKDYSPIVKAAEYAYEKYGLTAVFLPMEYPRDVAIGKEVAAIIKTPAYASELHHSIEELRGMLASAELAVGMRLHSLIFAASLGTPIVGISYDVKVDSFIKDSGAKHLIRLEGLSADALIDNIDNAIKEGRGAGEETKKLLIELEKKNALCAKRLLDE